MIATPSAPSRSPGLDGLRGLAIVLVLAGHLLPRRLGEVPWGGAVGVTLFFVLSGFLITRLLQRELDATAGLDLRAFYLRRVARLLPALLACLAVVALASVLFRARFRVPYGPETDQLPLVITIVLLFLANVAVVLGPSIITRLDPLKPTWSLAVEEQYYLLWPLVLRRLHRVDPTRRRRLLTVALVVLGLWQAGVTAASWRTNDPAITRWAYHGLDTNLFPLLVGSVLGLRATREQLPSFAWPSLPILALLGLSFLPHAAGGTLRPLVAVLSAWAIVGASNHAAAWLARGPLPWLGTISYALYLWHIPVLSAPWHLVTFPAGWPVDTSRAVATAALTIAIATASWFAVERPVGGWIRRRFAR